jgi:lysophospholipase L1-like esterase
MMFVPKWVILLGSVGRMYPRVRFSQWRQKLSGPDGPRGPRAGVAAAGALAVVLALLLGLGVAGVIPAGRAGAGAAGPASPARAAGSSGLAAAEPAGPGSRAAGAHPAGVTAGTSKAAASKAASNKAASDKAAASKAAGGRANTSRAHTTKTGTSGARTSKTRAPGTGNGRRATPARAVADRSGTSCRRVAHIGDSTSVGLVSPLDLPDPAQRLAAQYRDVGVRHTWIDASGGRSMVEEMPGQVNGYDAARTMVSSGFAGCWVIALGTNDTANVSVGSNVGRMARIQELMSVAHGAPVMWVDVKTLDPSGPWSEANMQLWNDTLVQACHQYPNLRIFDWASVAQDGWFISDGIHFTPAGYAARAHLIAGALARAFPRSGHSASCIVR